MESELKKQTSTKSEKKESILGKRTNEEISTKDQSK